MVKRRLWESLLALLYPERCCSCGETINCGSIVCDSCRPRLIRIMPPLCLVCGCEKRYCRCKHHKRHTDRCAAPFYYECAAKAALHRLKFGGKTYVTEMFGLAMAQTVKREYRDVSFSCIVPVPLSSLVSKKRKFNQSALLAKRLARYLCVPYKELLVKVVETIPQRELPAYKRSGNVLGVFDVVKTEIDVFAQQPEFNVLLVDDTVTTGATLDECAKILKLYGAGSVFAITATASRLSVLEK